MPLWRRIGCMALCLVLCAMLGSVVYGQDEGPLIVGFVEDRDMRTASITDDGADGLSRLGVIFRELGAETQLLRLDGPIPDNIDIVVLVRPQRELSREAIARLWRHLAQGKHLLLAADPDFVAGIRAAMANNGLNDLLYSDYGISANSDALIEAWFTIGQMGRVLNIASTTQAEDLIAHPIVAPLVQYDVPVQVWGASSLTLDAFGADRRAWPLLYTETAFGESNSNALSQRGDPVPPIELNIREDAQGRVLLGGVALNTQTGSRVALLGDSEMLQNLYGLARVSNVSDVPRYPGNRVLVERLAAWMMGLPEDIWPELPQGITWLAIDGDDSDWPDTATATGDAILDAPANDLQSVRAFSDDQFIYVLIEAYEVSPDLRLELRALDPNQLQYVVYSDGIFVHINPDLVTTALPDAAISRGSWIELRLPRRAFGSANRLQEVCLGTLATPQMDCLETSVLINAATTISAVPLGLSNLPAASLINSANLRQGPSLDAQVRLTLPPRTLLSVLGRDASGEWIWVRNGRWEGWVAAALLQMNIEIDILPVIDGDGG